MKDINLWNILLEGRLDDPDLESHLNDLAAMPLDVRVPYFSFLLSCLDWQPASLRRAALSCLAGGLGYLSWKLLVDALDDEDEQVREAAARSLSISAREDPRRWVHAMFHTDHAVRLLGLRLRPERTPPMLVVQMLGDPNNREEVLDLLLDLHLPPEVMVPILDFVDDGKIDPGVAAAAIAGMPWHESPRNMFRELRYRIDDPAHSSDGLASALEWAGIDLPGHRDLRRLLLLFWDSPREDGLAADLFFARLWLALTNDRLGRRQQMWLALLFIRLGMERGGWDDLKAAIAASAFPAILAHDSIDPEIGRRAALMLLEGTGPSRRMDPLLDVAGSPICLDESGTVNLAAAAGLLTLSAAGFYRVLFEHFSMGAVIASLLYAPRQGMNIFCPRALTKADHKARRQLLGNLLEVVHPPPTDIFAFLLLRLPLKELPALSTLKGCGEVFRSQLFRQLLGPLRGDLGELSEDRQAAVGEWLAGQWSLQQFQLITEVLLASEPLHELRFATALFGRAAARTGKTVFLKTVRTLSEEQLPDFLLLVDWTPSFPYDKEWELARMLEKHPSAAARKWAEGRDVKPPRTERPQQRETMRLTSLGEKQAQLIGTCPDAHLLEALRPCYRRPTRGLCTALAERPPSAESALEVCAALLVSHDSPLLVAELFEKYRTSGDRFLQELDSTLANRCRNMERLPLLGNAWLHRWDDHQEEFERQVQSLDGGIARTARIGLALASPALSVQVFEALLRLVQRFRWRRMGRLAKLFDRAAGFLLARALFVEPLVGPFAPADSAEFTGICKHQVLHEIRCLAAQILVEVFRSGEAGELLLELGGLLHSHLSEVPGSCLPLVSPWVDTEGVASSYQSQLFDKPADEARLARIRDLRQVSELVNNCSDRSSQVAEESALRLLQLGKAGTSALVEFLLRCFAAPRYRLLVHAIPLMDDEDGLQRLLDALATGELPPEVQFRIGVGLLEAGFQQAKPAVFRAACEPTEDRWFGSPDWNLLCRAGLDEREVAAELAVSHHHAAYFRAVDILVASTGKSSAKEMAALRVFLESSSERARHVRRQAAWYLHERGDFTGFPILLSQVFSDSGLAEGYRLITPVGGSLRTVFVSSYLAAVANDSEQVNCMNTAVHGLRARQDLLSVHRAALEGAASPTVLFRASAALMDREVKAGKLSSLASCLAWGILVGKQLTGKTFAIDTAEPDELGYTRLTSRRISVSPLPVLRRERRSEAVVKGLILHELGHHIYHSDPKSLRLWGVAKEERISRLFNLVCDEHLERNLRAKADEFGDAFKVLSAYAFQHRERPVHIETLVQHFGGRLFEVLTRIPLGVAREEGSVIVNSGRVLNAMEATGQSIARFVRALRMGLGNRHNDPKVAKALRLFDRAFRNLDTKGLLNVARKLWHIFQDEASAMDLVSQDQIVAAGAAEVAEDAGGITAEEAAEAARRILEGGRSQRGRGADDRLRARGVRTINLGPEHDFPAIERIERMPYDRADYRQYALRTARPSRRLRRYLHNLGLAAVDEQLRVSGSRLDRMRLQSAILRGDPRMLVGRRLQVANDLAMGVLVDCSGSMTMNDNIETAKLFAVMLAEAIRGLSGIDARFFGFTDEIIFDAGDDRRCAVPALEAGGGNNDAGALWHAACAVRASRRAARLLVMISDGSPTACTVEALRGLVSRLSGRERVTCAQVAVHSLDEICFPHYVDLSGIGDDAAVAAFGRMVARLVGRTVKGG